MNPHAWITLAILAGTLIILIGEWLATELTLMLALTLLLLTGVLAPQDALVGFANPGMITVAAMYVVAAGLRETGAIDFIVHTLLGRRNGVASAQLKIMLPTLGLSAFINNTPVVAAFLPAVLSWSRRSHVSASKLLIPLSYAAILGGTCTLIGTSTNLVVNGLWMQQGEASLGMFELAAIGLPCALVGLVYLLTVGRRLLPDHPPTGSAFSDPREYSVELIVDANGPLVGRSIAEAGLRHLGRLFLVEIQRQERVIPAVRATERLQADDHLVFAGDISAIIELQRIRGLKPALVHTAALARQTPERRLVEVVISPRCPLIQQTLRESRFLSYYNASVLAVARDGKRVSGGLGDITLRAADTLLLEINPGWIERHRDSPDFLLVSDVADSETPRFDRALRAWAILAGVVICATAGWLDMLTAALSGAALMLATGCISPNAARRSIDAQVLLVIACSFALGQAMQQTGLAESLATSLMHLVPTDQPWLALAIIVGVTILLTELLSNNATAVLMFPIALATAQSFAVSALPFVIAVMMAASASFATPLGYQTNLMVAGPGGYRFRDFLRVGAPLNLIIAALCIGLIPRIWPF